MNYADLQELQEPLPWALCPWDCRIKLTGEPQRVVFIQQLLGLAEGQEEVPRVVGS